MLQKIHTSVATFLVSFFLPESQLSSSRRWVLGLVNLSAVIIFWVSSSFLVNDLFSTNIYRKPFFITYINTSCFVFYLIPYLRYKRLSVGDFVQLIQADYRSSRARGLYSRMHDYGSSGDIREVTEGELGGELGGNLGGNLEGHSEMGVFEIHRHVPGNHTRNQSSEGSEDFNNGGSENLGGSEDFNNGGSENLGGSEDSIHRGSQNLDGSHNLFQEMDETVGVYETILLALKFIILWFSANLVTNSSLSYTSVASQTILSSTSSFFTLIFGYLYSIEKINANKVFGILLSFGGVMIVTKIDAASDPMPEISSPLMALGGNALALLGALIYGAYTILLKHKISSPGSHKERILDTHLFFGFVGLYCFVFFWPFLVVLHYSGLETFEVPTQGHVISLLSVNAFITFISDFCWCKAVLLTSPLTVTVGLSLTIPLAMVGDWVFKGFHVNLWYLTGAFIVTLGFLVINKDEKDDFAADSD